MEREEIRTAQQAAGQETADPKAGETQRDVIVTTEDLQRPYEVIGPVNSMSFHLRSDICDRAFERGIARLREKAAAMEADAVIGLRQNLNWAGKPDTWSMAVYGTAVRFTAEAVQTAVPAAAGAAAESAGAPAPAGAPEAAEPVSQQENAGDPGLMITGEDLLKYVGDAEEVHVPEGIRTIGPEAFQGTGVERVVLPTSLRVIRENAFASCASLREVQLPPLLEEIRAGAFKNCVSLRTMELPQSLREIDKTAFDGCPEDPDREDFLRMKEIQARDAEYLRTRRPMWRQNGRCQYCGGFFKGGLNGPKICSMCGMPKDY
ncbi:MAG: leucine-rich repeat protein [Lachnospiraceae bacterium]|nr:leucine-rich repeat protein [Lachnospiraceae bacterium]